MATAFSRGMQLAKKLCNALGIPASGCQRIVIEIDVRGPVKVWVKGLVPEECQDELIQAVKDAVVSSHGEVMAEPLVVEQVSP